jgi:lambda family phage tail tape measure protein
MPNSWKAAKELQTKFEELEGTLATTGSSLARLNEAFGKGVESSKEYGNYLNMFSNALQSQIDAYKKIIDAKKEAENVDLLKKASKEYALRGEQFNNDIYAIDQLIDAANRLGLSQGDEIERLKKLKKEYQDLEKFKGAINYGKSGMFMMGFRTEPEKEAERRAAELARGQVQVREDLNKPLQQRISISSQISKAADDSEKIIDDFNKKVSGVPLLGEKAATETSRAMAQVFNTFNTALKDGVAQQDETGMQKTAEGLIKTFEGLAPNSAAAAQGLAAVAAAAEAAALSGQKLSSTDIIKILQTFQPRVIDNINEKTQKYSTSTLKYFSELEASLNSLILSIARVDLEISKTSSFNDRIEALRGYASEQEIAFSKTQQYNKAELEFSKELRQAQLDLQKVLSQGVGTGAEKAKPEEVQAAKARYALAVGQAAIARDQKNLNADITAENKTLDSVLKQISEKYEAINSKIQLQNARTEASLKLEQERLRILKEAGALSEPRIVEMETQTQGRQIQQNFEQSNLAATTAANEAAEQARERYFAALERAGNDQAKIANAIDAYGTALVKVNAKEKDAQTLAAIRRDNEMEILRISSEARKVYAELAETEKTRAQQQALDATKLDTQRQLVDLQKEELQYKLDLGLITQDVYDKEVNGINKTIRAQEYKNKLLEIEARYKRETDKIEADIKVTGIAGGLDETGTGILTLEQAESFNKRKEAAKSQRDAEIKGAQDVFSANERLKGMYESMSTEQKGLASIYKDTFAAMGDSIVEFVRTGKMNFKSLITDMLASIAKLYLNRMFMSLFSNMLPGLPGMGTTPGLTSVMGVPNALGNVYSDKGLQKYAKGGMFTNSIVDSPTLFKFAKGTGLMGEAGPEAIIPLKRDSQGNLGVRGGGGGASVEVVVNNYSGEKAEARETTDSRGNRKVEVIVGDMVGGEVSRSSSSTHRSIRGTFGLQPQLIRR